MEEKEVEVGVFLSWREEVGGWFEDEREERERGRVEEEAEEEDRRGGELVVVDAEVEVEEAAVEEVEV